MSILKELNLILEFQRTIETVKTIKKFQTIPNEVFDKLQELQIDKIANGAYLEWILNVYLKSSDKIKNNFAEDLYKTKEDLINFNDKKGKGFWKDSKDINTYKSFKELYEIVKQYENVKVANFKVNKNSVETDDLNLVFQNSNWKIYSPKTKEASCVLGRGTRWCTAAQGQDNMFDIYNKQEPLYILINNEDKKFQFHFDTNQYMDSEDNAITKEDLELEDDVIDFFVNLNQYKILRFAYKSKIFKILSALQPEEIPKLEIDVFYNWKITGLKGNEFVLEKYSDSAELAKDIQIKSQRRGEDPEPYIRMLDHPEDYSHNYNPTVEDLENAIKGETSRAVEKFAIKSGFEDIIDMINNDSEFRFKLEEIYNNAEFSGYESRLREDILNKLDSVNDMGMRVVYEDSYYYLLSDGSGIGQDNPEDYNGFEITIPYDGYSDFDSELYNDSILEYLKSK